MRPVVSCFLPCRKGSERVPRKNIKSFSVFEKGLIELKLKQLCNAQLIERVYLSTNDLEIIEYAEHLNEDKVEIHCRCEELSSNITSTDDLVQHAADLIPSGHILWSHVTSPFVTADIYDEIITAYFNALADGFDSLMTTTEIHGFLWDENGPTNYDRTEEKWPRTQTLKAIHEVNSAAFIAPSSVYRNSQDRIGQRPFKYPLDKITGLDVDWPDDFTLAECIAKSELVNL
jgi:CMP-N-acetylneuraminic acid synthetase